MDTVKQSKTEINLFVKGKKDSLKHTEETATWMKPS